MSSGINLIVTKQRSAFAPLLDRVQILRSIAIFLLFGVSVCSMILFLLISFSPLPALQKQERSEIANLAQFHSDVAKLSFLNERANGIATLISKRANLNKLIDSIQNKLPAGVSIVSLSMGKKTLSVTVDSNSLATLDTFLNTLTDATGVNKEYFHLTLNNLSLDGERNRYLLIVDITIL